MDYFKYVAGVVVLAGVLWAGITYPVIKQALGSAVGSTFNDAKIAAVNMSPLTGAASSTSILNTDGSARWIKNIDVACTGVGTSQAFLGSAGLATFRLQAATTSTAVQGGNTNLAADVLVATTSAFSQSASSTVTTALSQNTDLYYWPANTYLTLTFNATNTAACIVSASYLAT